MKNHGKILEIFGKMVALWAALGAALWASPAFAIAALWAASQAAQCSHSPSGCAVCAANRAAQRAAPRASESLRKGLFLGQLQGNLVQVRARQISLEMKSHTSCRRVAGESVLPCFHLCFHCKTTLKFHGKILEK